MTWGAGYKGFNDTLASWSLNRIVGQQCGQTWLQTFAKINSYYNSGTQLPGSGNQNLLDLDTLPAGTHALDLGPYRLGTGTIYVQAVGKPSIRNQMSAPVKTLW
jgi:hypothetical protein